jgi:protease IV
MKKIAKIVLVLIAVVGLVEIFVLAFHPFSKGVEKNSVLTLKIEGDLEERARQDSWPGFFGSSTGINDIIEALDRASTDPRIAGVQMEVGESTLGIAHIQQLRRKLGEFHRAGKFSAAYLEFGTNRSYYVASASQTVVLLPTSLLNLHGMMTSTTFLRGTFDKLGIYPDFYHIGDYKNASNVYQEKKYTPAHREADQALLEDLYGQYVQAVADSRHLTVDEVRQLMAKGPFSSPEALAAKLVDRVGYADEFRDMVNKKNGGHDSHVSVKDYLGRTERGGHSKVAVILASGMILPGKSTNSPLGGEVMGADTIAEQFKSAREESDIKAVILRVDSPGGAAYASEIMRRELVLTKKQKPIVVSMSNVAASGGYWIAMSANHIVAEPGTITGSIGVLGGKFNIMGLYEKLGLSKDYLTTSDNATVDWPFQNFTPAQRENMQRYMHEIYSNFIQGVAEGRKMDVAAVDKIAQGRVWSGERALKLGLVDELGGLDTAIASAKKLASIPAGEKVDLVYLPPSKSFFEQIEEFFDNDSAMRNPASVREWLARLEAFARMPVWTVLPAVPEAQ